MKTTQPEKKRQAMRFTDAELSLIKNTFAENNELLKAIRKVFLQMPLSDADKAILNVFHSNDLMGVVRKAWLPTLDPEAPLHQLIDLYMTVDIKEKTPDDAYPQIMARHQVIAYLEQQLQSLTNLDESEQAIRLDDMLRITPRAEAMELYVNYTARNTIIGHTEMQLDQMRILAGSKDESTEDTLRRLQQNSTK